MNIIFILLDDLGWNDVGIHNDQIKTPNINQIAKEGCELTNNYTFPVCGPTRAMIQTGTYAYKYGMQKLFDAWVDYGLDIKLKIIPEYLKELKYKTYAIGKWHLGHNQKKFLPHKRGYDLHYGSLTGCVHHTEHTHCGGQIKEACKHDFSENGRAIYPKGHSCEILTDKAVEIINKTNNFFIYLAYLSPHVPLICPENFNNFYKNIPEPRRSYLGMISHLDYEIGRIINTLKEKNIYDETLIWIMSDNGGWTLDWACGDNYPLKNGKASFYQGGVKTFSIIKHKKIKIKKYNEIIHCSDVLPTILDFSGYSKPIVTDGVSLLDSLCNNKKLNKRNIVLGFYGENHWCFIIDNFKFIKLKKTSDHHMGVTNGKLEEDDINYIECYDLLNDPSENKNLIKEKYKHMKNKIEDQIKNCLKERVYENFNKYDTNEIIEICKKIKFWGQKNKNKIKLSILKNNDKENINYINSKSSLLELTGYDIFY